MLQVTMAALAVGLVVQSPARAADPIVISRQPWYGVQPQSPALVPGRLSLDFALVPATSPRGSTTALLAAARLPGRFAEIYGGRIEGAVNIVAIDLRTGAVYHNHAERGGTVPLASVMDPDPRPAPGVARFEQIDSYFNVDLRAQLRLPEHGAKYAVFLWLDDMVSPVRVAKLPGPPPSGREERPAAGTSGGNPFRAGRTHAGPGRRDRTRQRRLPGLRGRRGSRAPGQAECPGARLPDPRHRLARFRASEARGRVRFRCGRAHRRRSGRGGSAENFRFGRHR